MLGGSVHPLGGEKSQEFHYAISGEDTPEQQSVSTGPDSRRTLNFPRIGGEFDRQIEPLFVLIHHHGQVGGMSLISVETSFETSSLCIIDVYR